MPHAEATESRALAPANRASPAPARPSSIRSCRPGQRIIGSRAAPTINYQSIGSGGGIAQVKAGTVDFGATDQPLASDELAQASLAQFPIVIGGIVPVVNIAGLEPGKLKLTGPLLADIYAGKVKNWNDPAIAHDQSRA